MKVLSILGILLLALGIVLAETPGSIRKNDKREFWCCLLLVFMGSIFNIAVILNPGMASPLDTIDKLYQPLTDWISTLLQGE